MNSWNDAPITAKMPWEGHTEDIPLYLEYFQGSMFDAIGSDLRLRNQLRR